MKTTKGIIKNERGETRKEIIGIALVVVIIGVVAAVLISLASRPTVVMRHYTADITFNEAGDMTVVETLEMDYLRAYSYEFRDIDFNKYPEFMDYPFPKSDINRAHFDGDSVNVTVYRDGVDITDTFSIGFSWEFDRDHENRFVNCEPSRPRCEAIYLNAGSNNLHGELTIVYEFTIRGVVTEYSDISEINWVLFEYIGATMEKGVINVTLPENTFDTEDIYVWGHGIGRGDIEIVSNNQIVMNIRDVDDDQFLEFRILMPRELFPNIDPTNVFIHEEINKDAIVDFQTQLVRMNNLRITVAQVLFGLAVAGVPLMAYLGYRQKKKYFTPHATTFDGDYLRELPTKDTPAEVSYLYHYQKTNNEDVTATLLDLIRRKFITIAYEGQDLTDPKADFVLTLDKEKSQDSLLPHEKKLISWFFDTVGEDGKVTTKRLELYGKANLKNAKQMEMEAKGFIRAVRQTCVKKDYFDANVPEHRTKAMAYLAIPIAIAIIGGVTMFLFNVQNIPAIAIAVATAVIYGAVFAGSGRRSAKGQEEYVQWRAFRNFLNEFGTFEDYPMPGVTVWEHYLVYATSFKIADQVMKQLEVKLPMTEDQARQSTYLGVGYGYGPRRMAFAYTVGRINTSVSRARSNARRTISSSRASSAGRGGGFSGGSSRGGGGGGFRRG